MVYRVMVTSFGYTEVEADSEDAALKKVDKMDESDFDWCHGWSSEDAKVVDAWPSEENSDEEAPE